MLASSYYGWSTSSKKYGSYYKNWFDKLSKTQWLSTKELLRLQEEETLKFIEYAYKNVPYYRDLFNQMGLSPKDIVCIGDIRKIPILNKEMVRQNSERLLSETMREKERTWVHTSGTTGKALHLALSNECFQRDYAFNWLHRSWGDVDREKDKKVTIAGHPVVPIDRMKPPFWVYNAYEKQLLFSSYHLSTNNIPYYVEKILDFQPDLIHGYPSSIYLIADYLLEHKINGIKPKCVVTASETLLGHQRNSIEKAFGCKLLMWYGNTEMVANIVECPNGNLHLKHEYSYVEFLNDNDEPVQAGHEGRMVCTGFGNYAMPLIRYEIGDVAVLMDKECSCGRGGILLERIVGRIEDYIVTPDGRLVGRLDHLFKDSLNVQEAQLVQLIPEKLTIRLVKRSGYSIEDEKLILLEARNRLGKNIGIEFDYVSNIPRTKNGKFKFIISDVNLGKLKINETTASRL